MSTKEYSVSSSLTQTETIWQAQPRQRVALKSKAFELFYGGAAGGGKSDFLLIDFLNGVEHGAAHRGILFRRTYPELQELIRRSYEIYPRIGDGSATFNKGDKIWTLPGGATLRFSQMESDSDVHKYQGHQYTWEGWDELTNWPTDYAYVYMISRLRSAEGVPVRVRAAGNPGGVGHAWVKARFIDGKEPEKLYIDEDTGQTKVFVPAKLADNIILMQNDPGYKDRLALLPPHLRRAYLEGDWDIFAGQAFEEWRYEDHVVKPFALDPSWHRFVSLDWGYTKPFSIGWWAVTEEGRFIRYKEWYGCETSERDKGIKKPAVDVAREAWEMSAGDGVDYMVADTAIWNNIDGSPTTAQIFEDAGWRMEKANKDRISGLQRMHDLMQTKGSDGMPQLLVFSTCYAFIRTIPAMTIDEKHPEDVDTRSEDHVYDEARYALMSTQARAAQDKYHVLGASSMSYMDTYTPL